MINKPPKSKTSASLHFDVGLDDRVMECAVGQRHSIGFRVDSDLYWFWLAPCADTIEALRAIADGLAAEVAAAALASEIK